jgi:hypothetical protein
MLYLSDTMRTEPADRYVCTLRDRRYYGDHYASPAAHSAADGRQSTGGVNRHRRPRAVKRFSAQSLFSVGVLSIILSSPRQPLYPKIAGQMERRPGARVRYSTKNHSVPNFNRWKKPCTSPWNRMG